jgi:hypothetical protein
MRQDLAPALPFHLEWLKEGPADEKPLVVGALLATKWKLEPVLLEGALQAVVAHHDALQVRFSRSETEWYQSRSSNAASSTALDVEDLSDLDEAGKLTGIQRKVDDLRASLDLERGPLLRAAFLHLGQRQGDRLLLVAHHFVVDGTSLPIVLENVQMAYRQLEQGEDPRLPPEETSFLHFANRLHEYVRTQESVPEREYWRAVSEQVGSRPRSGPQAVKRSGQCVVSLDPAETHRLLREAPVRYQLRPLELLIGTLAHAFATHTGDSLFSLLYAHHGRSEALDIDVTRTVGWIATLVPFVIDTSGFARVEDLLASTAEQLRTIPHHGRGYLSFYNEQSGTEESAGLREIRDGAATNFGFIREPPPSPLALFEPAPEPVNLFSGLRPRPPAVTIFTNVRRDGVTNFRWLYDPAVRSPSLIEAVARAHVDSVRALTAAASMAP